jgi:DNA-binding transcriptional regulator YdaS (Cro superfamily)
MEKEPKELLEELAAWTTERYGRQRKIAAMFGVTPQQVNDWFAGRSMPTWETGHKIEVFLAMREHARREAIREKPQATTPYIQAWAKRNRARQKAIGENHGK